MDILKRKNNISKYLFNRRWVVIQYVNAFEKPINKYIYSIILNDTNYDLVLDAINKHSKVLIIAKWNDALKINKICQAKKLKHFYFHIEENNKSILLTQNY